jgi:hypothetical protein
LTDEELAAEPLKRIPQTCAIVAHMTEKTFVRLLKTIETDFPEVKVRYKAMSPGKLWIMHGEPPRAVK